MNRTTRNAGVVATILIGVGGLHCAQLLGWRDDYVEPSAPAPTSSAGHDADVPDEVGLSEPGVEVGDEPDGFTDPMAIGTVGEPCNQPSMLACAGHAHKLVLYCHPDTGKWEPLQSCSGQQLCDSRPGPSQGSCQEPVAACANRSPGDYVCDGATRHRCGPDLVDSETAQCSSSQLCDKAVGMQCPEWPSCVGVDKMCGPAGTADCCASPDVPGGTFSRSNDASYPATVGAFGLDSYEVTVGRFRAFVHAGLGTAQNPPTEGSGGHPKLADSGWLSAWNDKLSADLDTLKADLKCDNTYATWTDLPDSHEAFPMNCLTWFEAFAFCAWDGGRLPTEAEWNLADAGGDEHRVFPWSQPADSDVIDPSFAVYACQGDGSGPADCAMSDILPVGSRFLKGNAKWGQSDLAGSMAEWMLDWHGIYPSPCVDCANTTLGLARVVRGGAFSDAKALLRTDYRTFALPAARGHDRGARCARSL